MSSNKILMLLLLSSLPVFPREKVYMPFFETINVHSDYQYSTARLFKSYIEDQQKYQLVIPAKPDTLISQPPINEVQKTAKASGCAYFIIGDMNRIGETVILSAAMYNTASASLVWSDKLKAATPEDIDPILQKLARAIGSEKKAARDGDIYSVTSYESGQLRQYQVNHSFGLSVGAAVWPGKPFHDEPFSAGGGVFWLYDARNLLLEIDGQLYWLGDNTLGFAAIGAYYPLFPASQTPFLGGGLGLSFTDTRINDSHGSGMIAYLGGGYMLNRTSRAGLRIHCRYFVGAYKMDDDRESLSHGALINFEIYFGR